MTTTVIPRRFFQAVLPGVLALLVGVPGALSQEGSEGGAEDDQGAGELFIDTVDVNVINVDVYVTDRDGEPVTGLTAEDFEVSENGRPMTITNFYAIEGSRVRRSGPGEGEPEPEPRAEPAPDVPSQVAEEAADAVPEDQRLSLVVYVDNLNIRPHNRRRVLQDVRAFLRREITRDDRVMLVTHDRALEIVQPFTTDAERVVEALFEVDEVSGLGVHAESERRDVLQRIEEADNGSEALMWAENYAESVRDDLRYTVDALREMVSSLAGLPGRKALLYVSDGVAMIPGEDVFYAVEQKFSRTGAMTRMYGYDSSRRFQELAAHANANRVSFYTIDAAGLRVYSSATAEARTVDRAGGHAHVDAIRTRSLQAPLQMLAEETGGKAIINQNRVLEPLQRVATDFRTYYSIGYTPGHSGDGRYYRIEVKLKDPEKGWTVRHRKGYRDKPAESQMRDGVLAALNFPYSSNPLDLRLDFEAGSRRDDGHYLVPVTVRIPLRALTLVPRGEVYEANARLFLAARDDRGWVSEVQETRLPIRVDQEDVPGALEKHWEYTVQILLRSGEQKVAVGLRDEIAANNSFVTGTVYPGS